MNTPTTQEQSGAASGPATGSAAVDNALRIVKERLDRAPDMTFEKYHMLCAQNALNTAMAAIRDADRLPNAPAHRPARTEKD